MNNTLRQLEKNLRTFAKRCKGISYNKTLLFTFLFTGLTGYVLKAAPSDAEETLQKDVNATILDLRQSFKRTKEQNEKFLENANLEMAQLMMQGEQVIKSNWTSWQFGFGGMFNTQLSRYRGFGGKSDDIKYSRTNDLTKYVFDANQNHWNATTLDIKKNKEPDSKSIDPADIHQGYEPNTVTKLDRLSMYEAPEFSANVAGFTGGDYRRWTRTINGLPAFTMFNPYAAYQYDQAQKNWLQHIVDYGSTTANANANANANPNALAAAPATVGSVGSGGSATGWAMTSRPTPALNTANTIANYYDGYNNNMVYYNTNGTTATAGNTGYRTRSGGITSPVNTVPYRIGTYITSSPVTGYNVTGGAVESTDIGLYIIGGQANLSGTTTVAGGGLGVYMTGGSIQNGGSTIDATAAGSQGVEQTGGGSVFGRILVNGSTSNSSTGIRLTGTGGTSIQTLDVQGTGLGLDQNTAGSSTINTLNVHGTTGGIGVKLAGGTSTITNTSVSIGGATGIVQSAGTSNLTNITVSNGGIGLDHSGGTSTISGTVNVTQGTGIKKSGSGNVYLTGQLNVASGAVGVDHTGGTTGSFSGGTIDVNGSGTGILTTGGNFSSTITWNTAGTPYTRTTGTKTGIKSGATAGSITNSGDISFTNLGGGVGYGIMNNGTPDGNVTNYGQITISNNSGGNIGIYGHDVTSGWNGIKTSNITISGTSSSYSANHGIYAKNDAKIEYGTIVVSGNSSNAVRAVRDVTVNSADKIAVSGTGSNSIYAGRHVSVDTSNGNVTIENTGTNSNGINSLAGNVTINGSNTLRTVTITSSGNNNNSVYAQAGDITINGTGTVNIKNTGDYSNGVYSPTTGKNVNISNGQANIKALGTRSNGVYSGTDGTINITDAGTITSDNRSNGVYLNNTNAHKVNFTNFTVTDGTGIRIDDAAVGSIFEGNHFDVDGGGSVGFYLAPNKTITTIGSSSYGNSFIVNGDGSNGMLLREGSRVNTIHNPSFTVNGSRSNGLMIYSNNASTTTDNVMTINSPSFYVHGVGSTGLFMTNDSTANGTSVKLTNPHFTVDGGGSRTTSGILMHKSPKLEIFSDQSGNRTLFDISNGSIGIEIVNNGQNGVASPSNSKILKLDTTGYPHHIRMNLTGDKNIGINITEGAYATNREVIIAKDDSGANAAKLDMIVKGDGNVGFNNQRFAKKLIIKNAESTMNTNDYVGHGAIRIQNKDNHTSSEHNIIFSNLGYVKQGQVELKHIEVNGNENVVAFFNTATNRSGGPHPFTNNHLNPRLGTIGYFGIHGVTNSLKFQGVIGATRSADNNSDKNVGIYAISGQRKDINTWSAIGDDESNGNRDTILTDLTINDLNLGFGGRSTNGVLVYAAKGTVVSIANTSGTTSNTNTTPIATISDGTYLTSGGSAAHKWGYAVPYENISTNTTMVYSTGVFNSYDHSLISNNTTPIEKKATEVKVLSPVDMVSHFGVAYRAENGGKISVGGATAAATRAGGRKSFIAYANGVGEYRKYNAAGVYEGSETPINNTFNKKTSATPVTDSGSLIEINGGITAADNNEFTTRPDHGRNADHRADTYKNVAAFAINGGDIIIKGTKVYGSTKEISDLDAADANKSLIYGIGAYAEGAGSNVIYDTTGSNTGITVVSGENGALYAKNGGYIEFAGEIVHQNNAQNSVVTSTTANGAQIGAGETRFGRNIGGNDHANLPVFYVERQNATDGTAITFTKATKVDMYDGILYAGNEYNNNVHGPEGAGTGDYSRAYSDYDKTTTRPTGGGISQDKYDAAKYRGMENVTVSIASDRVNLGVINQNQSAAADSKIKWNTDKNASTTNGFLKGVADYAGLAAITNATDATTDYGKARTSKAKKFESTLINGELEVDDDVELENFSLTSITSAKSVKATGAPSGADPKSIDPFNDIKMESELVTINANKKVYGDVSIRAGQGLNMANSLWRWDTDALNRNDHANAAWRKTNNEESGYKNKGKINVWGGTATNGITGINVIHGTVENQNTAEIYVDHGSAIVGTEGSILKNEGKIVVSGKYDPTVQAAKSGIAAAQAKVRNGLIAETGVTGTNYGILGLSTNNSRDAAVYGGKRYRVSSTELVTNGVKITNKADGANGTIHVDGEFAVGIYAANKNYDNSDGINDSANQENVVIDYDNQNAASAGAIKVNHGNYGAGDTALQDNKLIRGVGIALVDTGKKANAAYRGGVINLNTKGGATDSDIVTYHNGIGIYGESTDIRFAGTSAGFTTETKNNGAGIWLTDDSNVGKLADSNGAKTYRYLYKGDNDKKGFGMIFGDTMNTTATVATNWLDIKFNNIGTTKEGIGAILVNTDANDWVKNYGKITEETSVTNEKAYGIVVNKGTVENFGDIELNNSTDIKKANVGIFANSHDNPVENIQTHIINYGDIKVGTPGQTKSFGIYGYNITHDKRADGTGGTITIGKESYGVYSGDGNVNIKGGKFTVGTNTVTTADERATGVYIEDNSRLTRMARTSEISADMEIDDYSFGIVVKKNTNAELPGAANTHAIRIGAGSYGLDANGKVNSLIRTKIPEITLGRAASTDPVSPSSPTNLLTNAVYYHSQDKLSTLDSFADIKMNGDYNYAYYTAGSVNNYGNIDLRSNVDLLANGGLGNRNAEGSIKGYGNVGIYSTNYNVPSTNFGTITTGASDLVNEEYSAAMAAGHYIPGISANSGRAEKEGYIINRGIINVQEHNGIGMFAVGANSIAKNYGTINLVGNNTIGMYLDQRAKGENYGTIISEAGSGTGIKGVVAINGAYIKNYGTIKILSPFGKGIVTSNRQVLNDNENSDVTGTQENIQLIAGTNEKTTGDGSTIRVPDLVPLTEVTINGVNTPIFKLDTNATLASPIASQITVRGSIQTGGTRIIDLSTWGNFGTASRSQVTRVGMYIDTSGVRYTNPIDGLENLHHLNEIDLLFGTEATQYTNAKAIELGENILKPYNDALRDAVAGGAILNPISANITWMAKDIKDPLTKLLKTVYLVKVPYTSFAVKGDENTYIFAENLEEKYETAKGNDKIIFNKVNGIGNGEGHILSQAFDEMKGHQYSNIQQRMQKTSDLLGTELDQLKNVWYNSSKDSNKIKSFGMKGEYKTDSATVKDYSNNAYGVAYVHEFETIRLGERTGFYAGAIYNRYNFKDIGHSKEDQYMMKAGLFRTTPFDENGTLTWTISGDGFISINEMKRRFWVVDDTFKAHSNYAAYGVTVNNEIGKEFGSIANGFDGFGVRLYGGLKLEYGRFTKIKEKGDMPLELKANGYYSARPEVGVQFKYRQPIFRGKTDFIAGLGFAFENELGKTGDVHNKARIRDTFKNYYSLTGEKDNKKGNFKSDLQLGLDNQRLGFTVNFGYDTKGNNMRGGLGFRAIY